MADGEMTPKEKKEKAADLYYEQSMTEEGPVQKEIAEQIGVTPRRIRQYMNDPIFWSQMRKNGVDQLYELLPEAIEALQQNLDLGGQITNRAAKMIFKVTGVLEETVQHKHQVDPITLMPADMQQEEQKEEKLEESEHIQLEAEN